MADEGPGPGDPGGTGGSPPGLTSPGTPRPRWAGKATSVYPVRAEITSSLLRFSSGRVVALARSILAPLLALEDVTIHSHNTDSPRFIQSVEDMDALGKELYPQICEYMIIEHGHYNRMSILFRIEGPQPFGIFAKTVADAERGIHLYENQCGTSALAKAGFVIYRQPQATDPTHLRTQLKPYLPKKLLYEIRPQRLRLRTDTQKQGQEGITTTYAITVFCIKAEKIRVQEAMTAAFMKLGQNRFVTLGKETDTPTTGAMMEIQNGFLHETKVEYIREDKFESVYEMNDLWQAVISEEGCTPIFSIDKIRDGVAVTYRVADKEEAKRFIQPYLRDDSDSSVQSKVSAMTMSIQSIPKLFEAKHTTPYKREKRSPRKPRPTIVIDTDALDFPPPPGSLSTQTKDDRSSVSDLKSTYSSVAKAYANTRRARNQRENNSRSTESGRSGGRGTSGRGRGRGQAPKSTLQSQTANMGTTHDSGTASIDNGSSNSSEATMIDRVSALETKVNELLGELSKVTSWVTNQTQTYGISTPPRTAATTESLKETYRTTAMDESSPAFTTQSTPKASSRTRHSQDNGPTPSERTHKARRCSTAQRAPAIERQWFNQTTDPCGPRDTPQSRTNLASRLAEAVTDEVSENMEINETEALSSEETDELIDADEMADTTTDIDEECQNLHDPPNLASRIQTRSQTRKAAESASRTAPIRAAPATEQPTPP